MKKKFKHIEFNFDWFHVILVSKESIIEELAEFFYLCYKILGVILGMYLITSKTWLLLIPIFFWLMLEIRLEKDKEKQK